MHKIYEFIGRPLVQKNHVRDLGCIGVGITGLKQEKKSTEKVSRIFW
jgi:hypothetical protein